MRIWGVLVLGLGGAAILLVLGGWQVQRLAWKDSVLADIASRIAGPVQALPAVADPETDRMLPVTVSGAFAGETVRVLVSQKIYGAGYRLINGFATDDGRQVIVDRGFVSVNDPMPATPMGQAIVVGNLYWPDEIDSFTPENDLAKNIWFSRDVSTLAAHLGVEPILVIARNLTPEDPQVTPLPIDTEGIPNDHLQYAITWFSLAIIWLGMAGYLFYRMRQAMKDT